MKDVHQQGGDSQEQRHAQEQPERREGQDGGEGMIEQVKDLGKPFGHKSTSVSGRPFTISILTLIHSLLRSVTSIYTTIEKSK